VKFWQAISQMQMQQPGYQQMQMQPQYDAAPGGLTAEQKKAIRQQREAELERRDFEAGRRKRDLTRKKDANNLIYILCLSAFVVIVMLVTVSLGDGWILHKLDGFGVTSLTMSTSLFEISIHVKCGGKTTIEEAICTRLSSAPAGTFSLHEAQNSLCALAPPVCGVLKQVYMCSFVLFGAFFFTAMMQLFGSLILFNYWFVNPLPKLKRFGLVLIAMSFFTLIGGLVAWTAMIPDITVIPMMLNAATQQLGAALGGILSLNPGGFCPYGWCWFLTIGIIAIILLQILIVMVGFKAHEGEHDAVEAEYAEYERLLEAKGNIEDIRATGGSAGMMQTMDGAPGGPMMQPGMTPMQPGMMPMQPGMMPMQPGMMPMQPYPGAPQGGYPMQPGMNYGATPQF